MVTASHVLDVVFEPVLGKLKEFRRAAKERRSISAHDIGADTLDYCAAEVEQLIKELASTRYLTAEQFAEMKDVTPQTVRSWIRKGELAAETTAKGVRIRVGSERVRRPKRSPRKRGSGQVMAHG
jgi:hypothetical protein